MDLARMRNDYESRGLLEVDVSQDPLSQFEVWLAEAVEADLVEPNAMVVSTVDSFGQPWSRHLLLKGLDREGFTFFTNYQSDKGAQIENNPLTALTFGWLGLNRQVNITGHCEKVTPSESDEYFSIRPLGSQLGAWASDQSQPLEQRADLYEANERAVERFGDRVPRPDHWGGYRLVPNTIEFWQGNPSRLHDRLRYSQSPTGWVMQRIAP